MNKFQIKKRFVVMAIYLVAVTICIFIAFNFNGSINSEWALGLVLLTLPWSLLSIPFAWALVHGAGLEVIAVMFFVFACLNCLLMQLIAWAYRNNSDKKVK